MPAVTANVTRLRSITDQACVVLVILVALWPKASTAAVSDAALITYPQGDPPFPAVVLARDCSAGEMRRERWAKQLAQWGYLSMLVEPGPELSCDSSDLLATNTQVALEYLASKSEVDPLRIAVMGWGDATALVSVARASEQPRDRAQFRAAVAFYPECTLTSDGYFEAPVLVVAAGQEGWARGDTCYQMARGSLFGRAPLRARVYPNVRDGFIEASRAQQVSTNGSSTVTTGASLYGLDDDAMDALTVVRQFLHENPAARNIRELGAARLERGR